jgi:hypothetical protein
MPGKTLAWGVALALVAAIIGWIGGAKTRDIVAGRYDAAVGPVSAGVVLTPSPTIPPTPAPSTPAPTAATPVPTVTPAPTVTTPPVVTLPPTFPPTATPLTSP